MATVVINCTGPNTILSEPIVKACIASGTHYVDISAELYHMLNIYNNYHKLGEDANVLIIPACGFATIPVTSGLAYLEKHFKGTLRSVECYTEVGIPRSAYFPGCNKCLVNYGTWASLVHELQNFKKYYRIKAQTYPEIINEPVPPELKKSFFHRRNGRFWIPYPGPDSEVVDMSQRYLLEWKRKKPYHFKIYTTMPLFIHFFFVVPGILFYYFASYLKCFRKLLWKFPRFFTLGYMSHEGPSEKMRNETTFSFLMTGTGRVENESLPNKSITIKVSGTDPGYQTTAVTCITSALTILRDRAKMPKGGVIFNGAAFNNTQIIDRLIENEIKFEVINS